MYGKVDISERHRHRYEFNNDYLEKFENRGMMAAGINPDSNLVEIMELKNHPWYIGTQFHPELKSRVVEPHPLFVGFIKAAVEHQAKKNKA
jgi:CTP synthase